MLMKSIMFAVMLSLSGCAGVKTVQPPPVETIVVKTVKIDRPAPILPKSDVLTLQNVDWMVVNKSNAEAKLSADKGYYVLDTKNYQNLSINLSSLMVIIQQKNAIIDAYEKYVKK